MAKKILVVDDQESMLLMLSQMLRGAGFEVAAAADGEAGLKQFKENPDSFQLILTDVNMPGLDGFELLKRIKATHPKTAVIFLSGINEGVLEMGGKEFGANAIINKPFQVDEVLKIVNQVLNK